MRLRTFESFWLVKNGILHSYPSLAKHEEICDIAVVGAGITGALISHALVEKGYNVVLLDKRDIAFGSTSATTSMLQYEIDVPLYQLAAMIGEMPAVTCYKAGIEAIDKLEALVQKQKLDCSFEKKQSLYIAREKNHTADLKKEFELRNKHQLGVKWLDAEEVLQDYGIKCFGAILSDVAGSADAYRLAHELIAMNAARGMRVYDQTEIKHIKEDDITTITTTSGGSVSCKKIIYCTGYEATEMLKEKTAAVFYTYACVSECDVELPDKLKNTLVWDTGSPYLYMRTTDDGRLLVGGEDASTNQSFFQNRIKERKSKKLQRLLAKMLPEINFTEDFSWGGSFGSTKDGLPYIGASPEFKNALFALGFGGNGIVFSVQAMDIITDLLEGKENDLAYWYRFGR